MTLTRPIFILCLIAWNLSATGQDARINSHLLSYEFLDNVLQVEEEYSITILNDQGEYLSTIKEYYDKGRKVKSMSVEIIDQNGKRVRKYFKADALDVAFNKSYEVQDTRMLILDVDYGIYPYTLNVKVSSESKWLISASPWAPVPSYEIEVVKSTFQVRYPKDLRVKIRQQNTPEPTVTEDPATAFVTKSWTVTNLAAIGKEMDFKHFLKVQPNVTVVFDDFMYDGIKGDQSSWRALGDWFLELNEGRDGLGQETKVFLDAIPKTNTRDMVKEVFFYMQDRTRYVSIQLGIGGFQTIPADEVDRTGYGDCKALTNYMKAMLGYLEIPSNYILVRAGDNALDLYPDFPSSQFNHVFLGIPGELDTMYLECTSQSGPFNYIGSFTDDRYVLWCDKGASTLIRAPVYKEDFNVKLTNSTVILDTNGNADVILNVENNGYFYDEYIYYQHYNSDQIKKYHYDNFSFKDFTIDEYHVKDPGREVPTYQVTFDLRVNAIAGKAAQNLIAPIYPFAGLESYLDADQYRKHGEVSRGFTLIDKINVSLPDGFFIDNLPPDMAFDSEYGKYSLITTRVGSNLVVTRELVMKKGTYDQDAFTGFYQFVKKVKAGDNRKLLISSKT